MRQCPRCRESYDDGVEYCPRDGTGLRQVDDTLIGQAVGHYRISSLIGEGGMGAVYLAVHPEIGSRVAVKVLHPELARDRAAVDRFFSEARSVNLIHHENIVNILDLAQLSDGRSYIVMEYLEGESLASRLRKKGPFSPKEAVSVILPVLAALQAAHEQGIIHRDLKPDNIFVTRGGHVKVLDFGIAKLDVAHGGAATRTGAILGTPMYMSPEQAAGRASQVDHRSDIYSVGIILHELLCGEVPFNSDSLYDLITKHLTEAPTPIRKIRPEVPEELEAVVLRALAKEKEKRFPTAAVMAEELQRIADQLAAGGVTGAASRKAASEGRAADSGAGVSTASSGTETAGAPGAAGAALPRTEQASGAQGAGQGSGPHAPAVPPTASYGAAPVFVGGVSGGAVPQGGIPPSGPTQPSQGQHVPGFGPGGAVAQAPYGAPAVGGVVGAGAVLTGAAASAPQAGAAAFGHGQAQGAQAYPAAGFASGYGAAPMAPGMASLAGRPVPPTTPALAVPPTQVPRGPYAPVAATGAAASPYAPTGARTSKKGTLVVVFVAIVAAVGLLYKLGVFESGDEKKAPAGGDAGMLSSGRQADTASRDGTPDAGQGSPISVTVTTGKSGVVAVDVAGHEPKKDDAKKAKASDRGTGTDRGKTDRGKARGSDTAVGSSKRGSQGSPAGDDDDEAGREPVIVEKDRRPGNVGNIGDGPGTTAKDDVYRRLGQAKNAALDKAAESPVSGVYRGRIHNTTTNVRSTGQMTLTVRGNAVLGYLQVDPPLYGSGPITGTANGSQLTLTVRSSAGTITMRAVVLGRTITGGYTVAGMGGVEQRGSFTMRK